MVKKKKFDFLVTLVTFQMLNSRTLLVATAWDSADKTFPSLEEVPLDRLAAGGQRGTSS